MSRKVTITCVLGYNSSFATHMKLKGISPVVEDSLTYRMLILYVPYGFWVTHDEEKGRRRRKDNKTKIFMFVFLSFCVG